MNPVFEPITSRRSILRFLALLLVASLLVAGFALVQSLNPALAINTDPLEVRIIAGYNLVVDSNVLSPSTYAPEVATVIGEFCNVSTTDTLTNVYGYIGDFSAGTPGIYPTRATDSGGAFDTQHPHLAGTPDYYSFVHLGGQLGLSDATRYMGSLEPGECKYQYWHFSYPRRSNDAASNDNLGDEPVWGATNDPNDDLWLEFDIWSTADHSGTITSDQTWKMTMRNEISAMANKIEPNPDGYWFNSLSNSVDVGEYITTTGVYYDLGNVNQGFDNDDDMLPDYNVWLQPVGDRAYDPSCLRLVKTTGVLTFTRSGGNPDTIINFENNLYFSRPDVPLDNNGGKGVVFYTFRAVQGPCSISLSPYQESASGSDNEKFNADFGTGIQGLTVKDPSLVYALSKDGSPSPVTIGQYVTFEIPFWNNSDPADGIFLGSVGESLPLVISDTIPIGTEYYSDTIDLPSGYSVTMRYYDSSTSAWELGKPGTLANIKAIQWRLDQALEPGDGITAKLKVQVPLTFSTTTPFIENEACVQLGDSPSFDCADKTILVAGAKTIGDYIWQDENNNGLQDSGETGIDGVEIRLYYDQDGDGVLDDTDPLLMTTTSYTNVNPGYYAFTNLPTTNYLVVVDEHVDDPVGYAVTTPAIQVVTQAALAAETDNVYDIVDFGYGPTLSVRKSEITPSPIYRGDLVSYAITLSNNRPGDGTINGYCQVPVYARVAYPDQSSTPPSGNNAQARFLDGTIDNIIGAPDDLYAVSNIGNSTNKLGLSGFNLAGQSGDITGAKLVVYLKETQAIINETIDFVIWQGDNELVTQTYTIPASFFSGPTGTIYKWEQELDTTFVSTLTFDDFTGDYTELQVLANPEGGQNGNIGIDAIAFVLTSDQQCGGAEDTISYLPLIDDYDGTYLQFYTAEPVLPNIITETTGPSSLLWSNLGPLYAGGTKTITVTFEVSSLTSSGQVVTDTAKVVNPKFANGDPVNDDEDDAQSSLRYSGSISGKVYADTNDDNWPYDAGTDGPLAGVQVQLWACLSNSTGLLVDPASAAKSQDCAANGGTFTQIAATTTDQNGDYMFDGLKDGFYNVKVTSGSLPTGFGPTPDEEAAPLGDGAGIDTGADGLWNSDSAKLNTFNYIENTGTGENITQVSFGYRATTSMVNGYVWNDLDNDGVWDSDESPIPNVLITLTCTGSGCASPSVQVYTDANGYYEFANLNVANASYTISSTTPAGMDQSGDPDYTGSCYGTGDCDNQKSAFTFTLASQVLGPYNFGYTNGRTIGDTVYVDWDGDGAEDGNEPGISDVVVYLYNDVGGDGVIDEGVDTLLATDTTDEYGEYSFSAVPGNTNYIVVVNEISIPAGYSQTGDPDESGDTCITCDGRDVIDDSDLSTDDYLEADFGYQPQGFSSIGDFIWWDLDGDGQLDSGETGLSGVEVRLYADDGDGVFDSGDPFVISDTTDSNGNYLFENLPAGTYWVDVDASISGGLTLSTGNDPLKVILAANQSYTEADFGYTSSAIGNRVWQDNNGDGNQDAGEPGIEDVLVVLYRDLDESGDYSTGDEYVAEMSTNSGGYYTFTGLVAGDYVVVVDLTNFDSEGDVLYNFTQTYDPDAPNTEPNYPNCGDSCDDQGALTRTGATEYGLPLGRTNYSMDFGYKPLGVIGDYIWIDLNQDGVQDANEPPIAGAEVTITGTTPGASCLSGCTATTDSDGYYSFGGLADGTYTVQVTSGTPSGTFPASDPDGQLGIGTADATATVIITSGAISQIGSNPCTDCDLDVDFGFDYNGANSISGTVFFDGDQSNTTYDGGVSDEPYANIPVYLFHCANADCTDRTLVASTTTDSAGLYQFSSLPDASTPGSDYYRIVVDDNAPALQSLDPTYTPDADSNNYNDVTPTGGVSLPLQDYGFYAATDYGDLPDKSTPGYTKIYQYPTASDYGGAYHTIFYESGNPDVILGTSISAEPNRQPLLFDASEDNYDDGVTTDTNYSWADGTAYLNVTANDSDGVAYLIGWVDWNNNGSFADPGDQVVATSIIADGTAQQVTFDVNMTYYTTSGYYYLRFRLYDSKPTSYSATGGATGGEVEDYQFGPIQTTPVTLSYFRSYQEGGTTFFEWSTETETGNIGFNLYTAGAGGRALLNPELIPATGVDSLTRQDYTYSVQNLEAKTFFIEDWDIYGETQLRGPFHLGREYGSREEPEAIDWGAVRAENEAKAVVRQGGWKHGTYPPLNLLVDETGLYRVTYEEMKAFGADWKGVPLAQIALTQGGGPVAITVSGRGTFGPGAYIEFYGQALDTLYTDTNVYTLVVDNKLASRIAVDNTPLDKKATAAAYYIATTTVENQRNYSFALSDDPWYDTSLLVYKAAKSWSFNLDVPGYLAGLAPATLAVDVWGVTDWPKSPDHRLQVSLNDQLLFDQTFDGLVQTPVRATLPDGLLQTGSNTLKLTLPADTGVNYDLIYLDGYAVSYPSVFLAQDGKLTFTAASSRFEIPGFPSANLVAYRLEGEQLSRLAKAQVSGKNGLYSVALPGSGGEATYLTAAVSALLKPTLQFARPAEDITSGGAELLIISHPSFIEGLAPLVAARQAQGYTVKVVDVEAIYAQFNDGIFDPQPIQDYIRFAATNLGTRFVLLVGGDTYDYRNHLGKGSFSFIPSLYAATDDQIVKFAPVDPLFADLDGDGLPDLPIGRFPVRTIAELQALIAKTLAYQDKSYGQTAVFAADKFDGVLSFSGMSELFARRLPPGWAVQKAYIDTMGVTAARAVMTKAINNGVALTTFTGHSGLNVWTFSNLFTANQAAALSNAGKPTVVVQWGCWNTYYVNPSYNTMAHRFLLSGDRGAAAVLGATTLTGARSEALLGRILMPYLAQEGMTLGEAVQLAKAQLAQTYPELLDVLLGWSLLGDPTLVIVP